MQQNDNAGEAPADRDAEWRRLREAKARRQLIVRRVVGSVVGSAVVIGVLATLPAVRTWATDRWGHLTCGSGIDRLSDIEAHGLGFFTDADPRGPGASGTEFAAVPSQEFVDEVGGLGRYVGTLTSVVEDVDLIGDTVVARDFTYGYSPVATAVYPGASPEAVWAVRGGNYAAGDENSLVFVGRHAGGIQVVEFDTATGAQTSCAYQATRPDLDTRNGSTHLLPDGQIALTWVDWALDADDNATDITTHVRVLDGGAVTSAFDLEGSASNQDASGDLIVTSGQWDTYTPETEEDLERLAVAAHSLTTGDPVWERAATSLRRESVLGSNLGPTGDATLLAGSVPGSGVSPLRDFLLVDSAGEELWRLDLVAQVAATSTSGAPDDVGGYGWFVADDVLVVSSGDGQTMTLQGVDIATGDVLWSIAAPTWEESSVGRALTSVVTFDLYPIAGRPGDVQALQGSFTQRDSETLVAVGPNGFDTLDLRDGSIRTLMYPEESSQGPVLRPELLASTSALTVLGGYEFGAVLTRD